jgi:hypothetical protein
MFVLSAKDLSLEEIDLLWADEEFKQAYRETIGLQKSEYKFNNKGEKDARS